MIVARVHPRRSNAFGLVVGQLRRQKAAAHTLELAQLVIFVRRDEIAGERAVARNAEPPRAAPASCSDRSCGRTRRPERCQPCPCVLFSRMTVYALCAKNAISVLRVNVGLGNPRKVFDNVLYHIT